MYVCIRKKDYSSTVFYPAHVEQCVYMKNVCVCKSFLKNIQETGNNSIWRGEVAGSEIQTKKGDLVYTTYTFLPFELYSLYMYYLNLKSFKKLKTRLALDIRTEYRAKFIG